jgi:hypothetical protein
MAGDRLVVPTMQDPAEAVELGREAVVLDVVGEHGQERAAT